MYTQSELRYRYQDRISLSVEVEWKVLKLLEVSFMWTSKAKKKLFPILFKDKERKVTNNASYSRKKLAGNA